MVVCIFRLKSLSCFVTISAEIWSLNGKTTRIVSSCVSRWCVGYTRGHLHNRVKGHKQQSSAIAKHYKNMHGTMPQGLLKRLQVLKKCKNKFDCLVYENAFYKSFKAKSQRAIRLHSWESIFIIFAPSYVNFSRQNRFKCCNFHDLIYSFPNNGVMTTPKRRILSFVFTVLRFKKSLLIRINISIIQIEYTEKIFKLLVSRSHGVMTVSHHGYYTTTSRRLFRHNPVSRSRNQPIRKSKFVRCSKVGRRGCFMVSALDSGASGLGSSPGRGHCVVFLGKTLRET